MSRPQFQAKAATLAEFAMMLLAYDCTAAELFEACERRWPWIKQSENWLKYGTGQNSGWAFRKLTGAYTAWVCAGRPTECRPLIDDLRDGLGGISPSLADEVIRDHDSRERRKFIGSHGTRIGSHGHHRAGERELDITYSCGCSGGLALMRVDAHGDLRNEEVAILAAKEYYHQC